MTVVVSPRAEKEIRKLAKLDQMAVMEKIIALPNVSLVKQLRGHKGIYRTRVGNYRVVYRQNGNDCYVELVGHRKDIYKTLERVFG